METAKWSSEMLISIDPSANSANCGDEGQIMNASKLLLKNRIDKKDEALWVTETSGSTVTLSFGIAGLENLKSAVMNISDGKGDYSIGGNPPLWVWWPVPDQCEAQQK